jgi:hypothetical protein
MSDFRESRESDGCDTSSLAIRFDHGGLRGLWFFMFVHGLLYGNDRFIVKCGFSRTN